MSIQTSWIAASLVLLCILVSSSNAQDKVTFDDHIKPIFLQRCGTCHNGSKKSGGLDLTNYTNLMQGGSSGESLEAGDAGSSYLYLLVTHEETPVMPPDGTKIPDAQIAKIETWINAGALENRGSVAKNKKKISAGAAINVGVRPAHVAFPWRMSLQPHFQPGNGGVITAMAISPWAPIAALGGARQILLYDNTNLQFLGALPFDDGRANVLKFSLNGQLLLAAGGRQGLLGRLKIWDVETTELITEFGEEIDTILAADISADHYLVAFGGPQRMLRVYAVDTEKLVYEIKKHTDWVTAISFSPDGVLLASGDRNGGVHVWEAETGNEYLTLAGHGSRVTGISWRGDANVLATCSDDGTIKLWEMERGAQIKSWTAHGRGVNSVDFNRDGQLVSAGRDANAKLWDQAGKLVRQFGGLSEFGVALQFCNESKRVVVADFEGIVRVFNALDGKELGQFPTVRKTLEQELQQTNSELAVIVEQSKPVEAQLAKVGKRLQTLQEQLEHVIANRNSTTQTLQTLQIKVDQTNEALVSERKSQEIWQAELSESEESLPTLAQAAQSARDAADKLPSDAELEELATKMRQKYDSIKVRIESLGNQLNQSLANEESLTSLLSVTRSKIDNQSGALAESNESIQSLNAEIEPVSKQKSDLDSELGNLNRQIEVLQNQVKFWKSEIDFDTMLAAKQAELQAAEQLVNEKEVTLHKAQLVLDQAQADHDAKLSDRDQSLGEVQEREAELKNLRSRK